MYIYRNEKTRPWNLDNSQSFIKFRFKFNNTNAHNLNQSTNNLMIYDIKQISIVWAHFGLLSILMIHLIRINLLYELCVCYYSVVLIRDLNIMWTISNGHYDMIITFVFCLFLSCSFCVLGKRLLKDIELNDCNKTYMGPLYKTFCNETTKVCDEYYLGKCFNFFHDEFS